MRKVEFIKERKVKPQSERKKITEQTGERYMYNNDMFFDIKVMKGRFHQWGLEIEEGETNFASCSSAIIEDEKGQVHMIYAGHVKFLDK